MTSEKQIAANQLNAQRSTGPRTSRGKQVSRFNAQRHGLTAKTVVLIEGEDPIDFAELRADLLGQWVPQNSLEEHLIDALAATVWRLRRATQYEATVLAWKRERMGDPSGRLAFTKRFSPRPEAADQDGDDVPPDDGEFEPAAGFEDVSFALDPTEMGQVVEAALAHNDLLGRLARYETHLMRQIERLLDQLRRLKAERPASGSST